MNLNDQYKYKYDNLISNAKLENRGLDAEPNYEIHHIIPRYVFGRKGIDVDNSKENLVKLTVYEHILAHKYWALYTEDPDAAMAFVFLYGKGINFNKIEEIPSDEDLKEIARIREISNTRNRGKGNPMYGKPSANRGVPMSEEQKKKISKALMGHEVSGETRRKIAEKAKGRPSPMKGKPMSEEQKKHLSDIHKGSKLSEETKQKIREGNLGKKKPGRSEKLRGTKWYNNGIIQIQTKECPEGFTPGFLSSNKLKMRKNKKA